MLIEVINFDDKNVGTPSSKSWTHCRMEAIFSPLPALRQKTLWNCREEFLSNL